MPAPRYWREIPQRYRFEAAKCKECGKVFFPPRLICEGCRSQDFEKTILPDEGAIHAYTIIRVPPSDFADISPYAAGIIELENGVKITAQIADCDFSDLAIGKKVRLEFRKIKKEGSAGIICYGYKAVLA